MARVILLNSLLVICLCLIAVNAKVDNDNDNPSSYRLTTQDKKDLLEEISSLGIINPYFVKKFSYNADVVVLEGIYHSLPVTGCSSIDSSGYIELCLYELGLDGASTSPFTFYEAMAYYQEQGYDTITLNVQLQSYKVLLLRGEYKLSDGLKDIWIPSSKKTSSTKKSYGNKRRALPDIFDSKDKIQNGVDFVHIESIIFGGGASIVFDAGAIIAGKIVDVGAITLLNTVEEKAAPTALVVADLLSNGFTLFNIGEGLKGTVVFTFTRPSGSSTKPFKKITTNAQLLGVTLNSFSDLAKSETLLSKLNPSS
eukprot:TRINITY_DN9806_c0_g1_i1.p1 TRINITY_DN9806_c0_g1~~TRINITY_DN9806_c0_g1_i1.p1  ORF type:complete len:311 (+),score=44.11 TRINITY_DN9806_c0_g1_i1:28-960(+)